MTVQYILGVGSSADNAKEYIQRAYLMLDADPCIRQIKSSRICEGAGVGTPNFAIYTNAAFGLTTCIGHDALWHKCQKIESMLGRMRPYQNAPRTIDLDILWASSGSYNSKNLNLPHPSLFERDFAIYPALEVLKMLAWPIPQALLCAASQTMPPNYTQPA